MAHQAGTFCGTFLENINASPSVSFIVSDNLSCYCFRTLEYACVCSMKTFTNCTFTNVHCLCKQLTLNIITLTEQFCATNISHLKKTSPHCLIYEYSACDKIT